MALEERDSKLYECSSCGALYHRADAACCGGPLEAVEVPAVYDSPELDTVVREVFDISSTELALCRTLMAAEEATIRDLTREVSRDRSVVLRHLDHLEELGLIVKRTRNLPEGGRVNVYAPRPIDEVRRRLRLGLYAWVTDAEERLEALNREKFEAMIEQGGVAAADDGEPAVAAGDAGAQDEAGDAGTRDKTEDDADPGGEEGRSVIARLLGRVRSR